MKKKKLKKTRYSKLLITIFSLVIFLGVGYFIKASLESARVLGSRDSQEFKDKQDKYEQRGGSSDRVEKDIKKGGWGSENIPTVVPTEMVIPVVDTVGTYKVPGAEEVKKNTNDDSNNSVEVKTETSVASQNDQSSNQYKTEKVVDLVSVTERSVVASENTPIPVATKSVLKVIQNKIGEVGRGEIISKPKQEVTLSPVKTQKEKTVQEETLTADADVFYQIIGSKVLLGAKDKDGTVLNIKEGELRSAEITLNKILDKQNMRLSMTSNNEFALVNGETVATLDMPVSVNIDSHKVYLETGSGRKELKIAPEGAVKLAVDLKSFERLNKDSVPSVVDMGEELAYKVVGDKTYKLFGLVDVKAKQNVYITAESGDVVEGEQPLFTQIVRLISK